MNDKPDRMPNVPPFVKFVASAVPMVFDNSLSYYEALCALWKYIQGMTDVINNNATLEEEYIEKFNELKTFVDTYFDNLDVQEEINNKLDKMVEEGTLQRILNSPATTENIGGVIIGNGLSVDSDGKIEIKAGNDIEVDADGVNVKEHINYLDIDVNTYNYVDENSSTNTIVNYSIVPSTYKPKIVMSDPSSPNTRHRASEIDYLYKPSLMINLSPWNTDNEITYGPLIVDNVVKVENNLTGGTGWTRPIVGIDTNGTIHNINGSTSASQLNMKFACRAWYTLYNDGDTNPSLSDGHDPRTFLAQDYDGNYLVGVCGGRKVTDTGMTLTDIIKFIRSELSFNAKLIYSLDGGGSSNLLYRGIRQNALVGNEDRACPTWLVFTSESATDNGVFKAQSATNMGIVDGVRRDYPLSYGITQLTEKMTIHQNVTLANGSYFRRSNGIVTLSFIFTVSDTIASYSDLFTNVPFTYSGNTGYYFHIYNIPEAAADVKSYLGYTRDNNGVISLRNRFSLPAGNYQLNLTLPATFA